MLLRRDCVLSYYVENLLWLCWAPCSPWLCWSPLYFMDIFFPGFAHFDKVALVLTVKTLYTAGWASLASVMLVITTLLTSRWVPRRSVQGCITFNGLVFSFTETINLGFGSTGASMALRCAWVTSSVRS